MLKQLNKNNYFSLLLIVLIFLFGSYISLSRGSNLTDGDSHSLILSFFTTLKQRARNLIILHTDPIKVG